MEAHDRKPLTRRWTKARTRARVARRARRQPLSAAYRAEQAMLRARHQDAEQDVIRV